MKKISIIFSIIAMVIVGVSTASCDSVKSAKLRNDVDSVSYAIGVVQGAGLKQQLPTAPGGSLNVDDLVAGFIAGIKGDSAVLKMTAAEASAYIQEWFPKAQARDADQTKAEGQKFLDENKAKSGVITTESGLQYQVITEGTGEKPAASDKVTVHYTGWLLDGTEFDSSIGKEPASFQLTGVIPGWTEGLQIMPKGSKYIFWIPSDLAYGERGSYNIKANSVLKFEVELLDIEKDTTAVQP
ncbi:MAG: FKBP-type peptidyl-prolyl cis-trans isomerase [Tannerellaceae bacterium]|jgi:FKBP-type peptidyl-prolyl cis-trans isomerase FkpA/FKBP-type peptidyl-prolyl cis-trans isomerase FklB|nr:FKBP-type peptidyl-prolyl cis-trans isomerase [Tannerellaceae bacterium]